MPYHESPQTSSVMGVVPEAHASLYSLFHRAGLRFCTLPKAASTIVIQLLPFGEG